MDQLANFPMDGGLWWVRWVDDIEMPVGGASGPGIHVLLSPLQDSLPQDDEHRIEAEGPKINRRNTTCQVLVGTIPGLTIGTIFRQGRRAGSLKSDIKLIEFKRERTLSIVRPAFPIRQAAPPAWWPCRGPWIISKYHYPLDRFGDSRCLVMRDSRKTVVIPCFEIFRTLYAPHQEIASALLSGPWRETWSRVANPVHTQALSATEWRIGLRKSIKNAYAHIIANLTLGEQGRKSANLIHTAAFKHAYEGEPLIPLWADIPFEWNELSFRARYMTLSEDPPIYLCYEILDFAWPLPPISPERLWYYRDNSGTPSKNRFVSELPRPFHSNIKDLSTEEEGVVPVLHNEDPSVDSQSEIFPVTGPAWSGLPPLCEVPKVESYIYEGFVKHSDGDVSTAVSPGNPGGSNPEIAKSEYVQVPRRAASHRFTELIELLQRLKKLAAITGWGIVRPPYAPVEFEDGAKAWPFLLQGDPSRPWCYVERQSEHVRSAFVCEIHFRGEAVYWLELEIRPEREAFRSVLFRADYDERTLVIEALMRVAEREKGVWPRPESVLASEVGTTALVTWRHQYDDSKPRRIDERGPLRKLQEILQM